MVYYVVAPKDRDLSELRELLGTYHERDELTIEGMVDSGDAFRVDFEGSIPQLYLTIGLEPKHVVIRKVKTAEF